MASWQLELGGWVVGWGFVAGGWGWGPGSWVVGARCLCRGVGGGGRGVGWLVGVGGWVGDGVDGGDRDGGVVEWLCGEKNITHNHLKMQCSPQRV